MKLLVNISSIGPRPTGLGTYAVRCARAAASGLDAEVVAGSGATGIENVVLRAPASLALGSGGGAAVKRFIWSKRQRRFTDHLVYSPTHHGFGQSADQLLTVHDLISLRYPRQHPAQYLFFRHALPAELARCRGVFTVSETTKQDIHETYRLPLDRIWVVPNGIDRTIFRPARRVPIAREPFLLVVGATFPHKNVEEILDHAPLWCRRYRLVVVSCRGAYRRLLERRARTRELRGRVEFVDYAPLPALVSLYQRCAAFIYPSRWEGFGIPPLEALACGARVIVSDIPAHREVLGSYVNYVRLGASDDWERAFASLEDPQPIAASTRLHPLERYSWERSAEKLIQHLVSIEPRLGRAETCTYAVQ